jgi:hypothetical protein
MKIKSSTSLLFFFGLALSCFSEDIMTIDGKTYSNIKVIEINATSISLSHRQGLTTIAFSNLSPELKQKYGYDPLKEAEAQKKANDQKIEAEKKKNEQQTQRADNEKLLRKQRAEIEQKINDVLRDFDSTSAPYVTETTTFILAGSSGFRHVQKYDVIPVSGKFTIIGNDLCGIPKSVILYPADKFIENMNKTIEQRIANLKNAKLKHSNLTSQLQEVMKQITTLSGSSINFSGNVYDDYGRLAASFNGNTQLGVDARNQLNNLQWQSDKLMGDLNSVDLYIKEQTNNLNTSTDLVDSVSSQTKAFYQRKNNLIQANKPPDAVEGSVKNKDIELSTQKLKTLKKIFNDGLITQDEYESKKKEILDKL